VTKCPHCWGVGTEGGVQIGDPCLICGGRKVVDDYRLSSNFWLSEHVRAVDGYDMWPGLEEMGNIRRLYPILVQRVRDAFASPVNPGWLRVNSGYRVPALDVIADHGNTVWLTRKSAHATGAAADVCPVRVDENSDLPHTLSRIMRIVRDAEGLGWDQAILEGGCVHLALYTPGGRTQRRQLLIRCPAPAGSGRAWDYPAWDGSEEQLTRCA
jgi:hypothetical protein